MAPVTSESGPVLDAAMTVTSADGYYVAPYIAALDTSGTAVLTAVQLSQLSVAIADIQRTFKVKLTGDQTAAFLNAFTVSKNGAALTVALDKEAFKGVFDVVIDTALDEDAPAVPANPAAGLKGRLAKPPAVVKDWLSHGLKNTLVDYILRTLKVSAEVTEAPVTVNAGSAASQSMADGIALSSDVLEAIYLQVTQATLELYRADNIPTTNALPLKSGDKMTFVFDTAPLNIYTTVSQTQSNASSAAVNAAGGQAANAPLAPLSTIANKYAQTSPGSIVLTDTYRVAFEVEMGGPAAGSALPLAEIADIDVVTNATPAVVGKLRRVDKKWWNYA